MKDMNKALLVGLLTPAYLTALLLLFGAAAGGIRWGYTAIVLLLFVAGAWLLSCRSKLALNVVGFVAFLAGGGYIIVGSLLKPANQRSGFEFIELAVGVAIILFGLVPLLYQLVKWRSVGKE